MSNSKGDARPLIYLIAGEPSGDNLGARLMAAIKKQKSGNVDFVGIGGPRMKEQGLESLFPMEELSIMGFSEILPHIPKLLGRISKTVEDISSQRPAAVLTIDTPAFSFRVAKRLKGRGIPLIHFVAPSVWAWKPWRAKKIAGFLDHLLTLLPFEPPYFEKEGLSATFVGHPVLESGADKGKGRDFRKKYGISADQKILCMLPGSRRSETDRLLPIFKETCQKISRELSDLVVVVPAVESLSQQVGHQLANTALKVIVLTDSVEKFDAFSASDAALAASGTVSLELAMAQTPAVIAYKVSPLTAWIAKKLVRLKYVSLVNILTDREVVPEFLLDNCQSELIAPKLLGLLTDEAERAKQLAGYLEALEKLKPQNGGLPSEAAATALLKVIEREA